MKKNYFFRSLFAVVVTVFMASCSMYDDPVPEPVPDPEPEELYDLDLTELVSLDWGGSWCATQYAPAVTTADGRIAQMQENYQGNVDATGILLQQTLTDLKNGKYKIELYANAFFTDGRGFESDMQDGAMDVAYVFANEVKCPVVGQIATATDKNGEYALEVEVTDGTLTMGLGKEKAGTNWHTIQIKSLVLVNGTNVKPEPKPESTDIDCTAKIAIDGWGQEGFAGTWAAPEVFTADGRSAQMAEKYHGSNEGIAETGIMMEQTVEGLENGNYIVELYANSMYTPNRGFDSDMADGATDVAYVFANAVKVPVIAKVAETTSANGLYAIEVTITDGKLTMGIGKDKGGTSCHTIQSKSLTLK
jgi:hypothetical protein